jgi:hypothetical protein
MNGSLRKWRTTATWLIAGALLLVGVVLTVVGLQSPRSSGFVATTSTATSSTTTLPNEVVGRSVPIRLRISVLGLSARIVSLGLNRDGTVQVPSTVTVTGWYRLGPAPGQSGSAVILGHVDSYRGPGVFFRLRELVPGDLVSVTLANRHVEKFEVNSVHEYSKKSFPDALVYGSHGRSELQLVTCGGVFNSATGSYESNIVVFSTLTK